LCRQARAFSEPELARAVVRLAELDEAIKGGSRLDPRLELELALVENSAQLARRRPPPRWRRWSRWRVPD
jgi:DNA polymerase III delta subunit